MVNIMTRSLVEHAVDWANMGVPVFPCNEHKKELAGNGLHDAVSDPDAVRELFGRYGSSAVMIGGRMGRGIFAVDADLYKGDHVREWIEEHEDIGAIVPTRTHGTKNGGLHLLYSGETGCSSPAPGVEIKGDGGYIILPGSPGYEVIRDGLAEAPARLYDVIWSAVESVEGPVRAALESNIRAARSFHVSLTQLAARMANDGMEQLEIQADLLEMINRSAAARPTHARHERWTRLAFGEQQELSRIVSSAHRNFNDDMGPDGDRCPDGLENACDMIQAPM